MQFKHPLLAAALLTAGALNLFPSAAAAQSAVNGIAAIVNGKVITKSQVREAVQAQIQLLRFKYREDPAGLQKELDDLQATALESLIDRELILTEFQKLGGAIKPQYIDDDINGLIRDSFKGNRDEFVTELAKAGMTMKKFRDLREKMIIVQVMRGRHTGELPPPTPREVEEFYRTNNERFRDKDMIKISTITVPKYTGDADTTPEKQKKLAQEVRSKIIAGADFATMAKTYSQDSRAENGGEWDWMERKQMKKSMADAAFALKNGGVSQVIDDETAYIVIYCDAKKFGEAAPLDKVRPDIEKMINQEKSRASLDQWLKDLRRKAVIRILDKSIPMTPPAPRAVSN